MLNVLNNLLGVVVGLAGTGFLTLMGFLWRKRSAARRWALILPLLQEAKRFNNLCKHELGFAVFDGTSTPKEIVDVFDFAQASELVLASDGYTTPQSTLEESEKLLAAAIERDPLRLEHPPGTKVASPDNISFDDRTYVRVRIS